MSVVSKTASAQAREAFRWWGERTRAFLHWWAKELLGLFPESLRRRVELEPERWVIELDPGGVWVRALRDGDEDAAPRMRVAPDPPSEGALAALRQLDGSHGRTPELGLEIPAGRVLRKLVTLPLAAEENLREVLGYGMDQETPFRAAQVYYDFRVVERDRGAKRVRVELFAVPRAELDEILDRLAALGLYPDLAVPGALSSEHGSLNLLPPERRRDKAPTWKVLNSALAAAAGALLLVAVALPLWQRREAIVSLEGRIEAVKKNAEAVEALRSQVEGLAADARFLVEQKRSSPVAIAVLAELSRVLPDDTWLYQFELNGKELLVQGESTTSSAVIGLVEASPLFRNAAFRSPVTQNRVTGAERFNLSAEVVPGAPS